MSDRNIFERLDQIDRLVELAIVEVKNERKHHALGKLSACRGVIVLTCSEELERSAVRANNPS